MSHWQPAGPQMSDFSDARQFDDIFDILGLNTITTSSYRYINPVIYSDMFDMFGIQENKGPLPGI
jgi:hypothetical protein